MLVSSWYRSQLLQRRRGNTVTPRPHARRCPACGRHPAAVHPLFCCLAELARVLDPVKGRVLPALPILAALCCSLDCLAVTAHTSLLFPVSSPGVSVLQEFWTAPPRLKGVVDGQKKVDTYKRYPEYTLRREGCPSSSPPLVVARKTSALLASVYDIFLCSGSGEPGQPRARSRVAILRSNVRRTLWHLVLPPPGRRILMGGAAAGGGARDDHDDLILTLHRKTSSTAPWQVTVNLRRDPRQLFQQQQTFDSQGNATGKITLPLFCATHNPAPAASPLELHREKATWNEAFRMWIIDFGPRVHFASVYNVTLQTEAGIGTGAVASTNVSCEQVHDDDDKKQDTGLGAQKREASPQPKPKRCFLMGHKHPTSVSVDLCWPLSLVQGFSVAVALMDGRVDFDDVWR